MKNALLRSILLVFLLPGIASAQKNYSVSHYTGENGLPQNSVKTISEDSEGFIWMGTEDGLVRFDGKRFYIFNRTNLKISNTRTIFARGSVKAKNPDAGAYLYPRTRNAISYVYFYQETAVRIQNGTAVRDTAYADNHEKKRLTFIEDPEDLHATGLPNFVNKMMQPTHYIVSTTTGDGDFFTCDNMLIKHYANWQKQYSRNFRVDDVWNYFSVGENLHYYHQDEASVTSFSGNTIETKSISGEILNHPAFKARKKDIRIYWNNVSDQIFLYLEKELYTFVKDKAGNWDTRLLIEDFDFESRGIEKIHYDEKNGKIYLGSGTDGLYVLSRRFFQTINTKGDFRDNVFYAQIPFDRNSVLTATGRIVGRDFETGQTIDHFLPVLVSKDASDGRILLRDRADKLWVKRATQIYQFDNKKLVQLWDTKLQISTLYQGETDRIWIGLEGFGLSWIDPLVKGARLRSFLKAPLQNVTVLRSLSKDTLIVGTTTGLYRVDVRTKAYRLVKGTEGMHVKSIHVDRLKRIWFTALDNGILLVQDGNAVTFPMDKNRYLGSPHCIVEDGLGYFWIPTNNGLFQLSTQDLLDYAGLKTSDRGELFYAYHSKDEGFNTNEFNGSCDPCGLNLQNGHISLPSLNGFIWFRPEQIKANGPDAPIILDKVEVNQKVWSSVNDTLHFALKPQNIRFYLSTAYQGNRYNLNLSYALVKQNREPGADDWISINNGETDVRFSNLNSGNYTLIIRKLNGFGLNNYCYKKIYLMVPLLWYETWWAVMALMIGLFAVIYFYNKFKLRQVTRENSNLEKTVALRTRELNTTMNTLEDSKNELSKQVHVLSRLLTSMTHDIQSPLNFISITSSGISCMMENGQYDQVLELGEMISDSSKRMSLLLRDLLNYIKINVYGNRLQFEELGLHQLIEEKQKLFKNVMNQNEIIFINEISSDTKINCDLQMVSIMIHNLIDNASKFTKKGVIRISSSVFEDNKLEVVVSNTALGIPPEIIEMINTPTDGKTNHNTDLPVRKLGLGLIIVKEVATLIGVSLKVTQTNVTNFHLLFE